MTQAKYHAFISYSHVDRRWARWLLRKLETYRPPPNLVADAEGESIKRLRPIFRDRDELPSTSSLSEAVNAALKESRWLIVICSPAAAASKWVNEEIRTFRRIHGSERILAFVVAGEPGAGDESECFPQALVQPHHSGDIPLEPVAADARHEGDGPRGALLKLAAGMLGVGLDSLRQRDSQRQHRKLLAITAGSLSVALITIALAVNAVKARNEAQDRREQAEELIDFMLGDLRSQLRKIGRLDVFQSVGDEAMDYFAAQRDGDDSPSMLNLRAKNLRQIGEVRREQGQLDGALDAYQESLLITQRMAMSDPNDLDAQIAMGNSLFYVGYVHWQRGQIAEARAFFERIILIVDGVLQVEPNNPKWLAESAYANTNLGRVLELKGDLPSALDAYMKVMLANQRLTELEPESDEWQMELGFAHNNLGKLLFTMGRLDEAEQHYRSDLNIKQYLHDLDPSHNVRLSYLASSQYFLGYLLSARGVDDESFDLLAQARLHYDYLIGVEPKRHSWIWRRANVKRELGKLAGFAGQFEESLAMLNEANADMLNLLKANPENGDWRRALARGLVLALDFTQRRGLGADASEILTAVDHHIGKLVDNSPDLPETNAIVVYAHICKANSTRSPDQQESLIKALSILDQRFPVTQDPRIIELKAAAHELKGETDIAKTHWSQLETMSFSGLRLASLKGD